MNQTVPQHLQTLGEQLEQTRLALNISQADLAASAGIGERTLRRLESGEGGSMDSFVRLLIALNLDANLSMLIPDYTVRPMERASNVKAERSRASSSSKTAEKTKRATTKKTTGQAKPGKKPKSDWTWGDGRS